MDNKKAILSVRIQSSVLDCIRDYVYQQPGLTLTQFVEDTLSDKIMDLVIEPIRFDRPLKCGKRAKPKVIQPEE